MRPTWKTWIHLPSFEMRRFARRRYIEEMKENENEKKKKKNPCNRWTKSPQKKKKKKGKLQTSTNASTSDTECSSASSGTTSRSTSTGSSASSSATTTRATKAGSVGIRQACAVSSTTLSEGRSSGGRSGRLLTESSSASLLKLTETFIESQTCFSLINNNGSLDFCFVFVICSSSIILF